MMQKRRLRPTEEQTTSDVTALGSCHLTHILSAPLASCALEMPVVACAATEEIMQPTAKKVFC
jgi:hypothetical protein